MSIANYESGETPKVGDFVQCVEDEDSPPRLVCGVEYQVSDIDGGYVYFRQDGWWPTRLRLVDRLRVRQHEYDPQDHYGAEAAWLEFISVKPGCCCEHGTEAGE